MTQLLERLQTVLGERYTLVRELGRGGMATVYLAEDRKHRRRVAVKVLLPELAATLGAERFVREIAISAKLSHPHILMLIDSGEAEGFLYYVMPYVEGESLRERLEREGRLPVPEAVRITEQVAAALSYAHQRGVIHRDIKPENILLAGDQAIVADFGIARAVEAAGGEKLTGTGLALGTPAYMSPEQVYGRGEVDGRSDVYALGCVVFEMVTGRAPFEGSTPHVALVRHAVDPVPSVRALVRGLPLFVERAVQRALAKDPAARFPTPTDFAATLAAAKVVPRPRRRRWLASAASLAGIAAVLLGLNVGGLRDRLAGMPPGAPPAAPPIKLAVLPFENLTGDPEQEYFSDGLTEELITQLGRLHPQRLSVIARTSSMRYRDRTTPLEQIGRELGVDYVLEGSARREGSRVRISATLIHVADQTQRWAESFDRELAGILALQHDVARGVARSLALALLPAEEARLAGASRIDPEAYEAYLRGLGYLERGTTATRQTALHFFERALARDSTFALAHLGIRQAWAGLRQAGVVPSSEAVPTMRAALARAFELDDRLPEVHYALAAEATWTDWNWPAAEAHFRRAIDLNPNYAEAHAFYAHYLHIMGRPEEAMLQAERALELDPLNPVNHAIVGGSFLMARRYDEAIAHFQTVLRLAPGSMNGLIGLSNALHYAERYEEAFAAERESVRSGRGDPELEDALVRGFAEAGYQGAMRQGAALLAERSRSQHVPATRTARLYLRAGDNDRALDWLERSYTARDPALPYIGSGHKDFDPLRDHPRFVALLRQMKLPH